MKDVLLSLFVGSIIGGSWGWLMCSRQHECEKQGAVDVRGTCVKKECITK